MSDTEHEENIIEYEAFRNEAEDLYFNARPQLLKTSHEVAIFTAGFRMAWNTRTNGKEELIEKINNLNKSYENDMDISTTKTEESAALSGIDACTLFLKAIEGEGE